VAPDPAAVVLLHGWALHGGVMAPLARALQEEGHATSCPDLPGHGGRPFEPPFRSLEDLAATLAADLPPACTLLGWSLGGMVAARLAADGHPAVRRLVLVATTPRFVAAPDWRHGLAAGTVEEFSDGLQRNYRGLVRRFLSLQARGDERAAGLLRELRAVVFARGEPAPAALAAGLDVLRHADLRAAAGRIRVPTLVVSGRNDRLTLPGAAAWLAQHVPAARHREIPGAGHAPFLSHPQAFLAALRDFLPAGAPRRARA
jgi:pimeloyl-[acyl-carrier protein] methyl ester esterase